jgi:leader peptidase (prepilin peptidase) / N-methyltransferase
MMIPLALLAILLWVFVFGLCIGSFLNVFIARLPFEKSVVWPGSRCFTCLNPLRLSDNLPIIGYLRLGGRCRFCNTPYSARYLWVELVTGFAFVVIFAILALTTWLKYPAIAPPPGPIPPWYLPPLNVFLVAGAHACLMSLLIASAVIDYTYRIIPGHITYLGTLLGITLATLMPWPWPNVHPMLLQLLPAADDWAKPGKGIILNSVTMLPVWGPLPSWLPPGSWQLGLVNGVVGAIVGQAVGRAFKFLFETGFKQEALGLGDADLLMMIGAFLGWQIALMSMPLGALVLLPVVVLVGIVNVVRSWFWKRAAVAEVDPGDGGMPFGPGIVAGTLLCWLGWPIFDNFRIYLFDSLMMGVALFIIGGGLPMFGFLLRR